MKSQLRRGGVACAALLAALHLGAAPLTGAKVQKAAGDLAGAVRAAASGTGPAWIGYSVASAGSHHICCGWGDGGFGPCGGRCPLDSGPHDQGFSITDSDDCRSDPGALGVFLKIGRDGRAERIRVFSESCAVDAQGISIAWLDRVSPAESVAFLESLVTGARTERRDGEGEREPWNRAITAIALHDDPSADAALERFVSPRSPEAVRAKTVFWLGNVRGNRGYEVLRRLAREEESESVRKKVTFALSQSPVPAAVDTLIAMAKTDASSKVRGQALFWLAQKASRRAADTIQDAIRDDPETEVKKRAVFALSQLPPEESVTQLIRVARTNRNPAVRKQAIFWLGQSKDPKALEFLEEILSR
ncbi:MAG TPA: HEAT repeat domain-containing protein [Thermoanaerobaculia bacterium]|nr:HEAT repeat domain-containing protein [Thermoanaerobaculia bacterium]